MIPSNSNMQILNLMNIHLLLYILQEMYDFAFIYLPFFFATFFFLVTMCFFVFYCFLKMPFLSLEQSWIRSLGIGKSKTVGLHRQVSVFASRRLIYFSIFQGKNS